MGANTAPPPTSQIAAAVKAAMDASSVVLPSAYTVDTLPTPSAALVNKYARVTDLFGNVQDLVKCFQAGSAYYWRVVSPFAGPPMAVSGGTLTVRPLKTPMSLFLSGTLTASLTVNLSTTLAWPGQEQMVGFDGTLGLYGINIAGLGNLLNLARRRFVFDGITWQQG